MEHANTMQKRELNTTSKAGLQIKDLILAGILLSAGAVLKFFVGNVISIAGMKPNFIIAMYCLAILLIRPKLHEAGIIGLVAGAICQFFPGTPYLNFLSEALGALTMCLMIRIPMRVGKVNLSPVVSAFVSTVISGGSFTCGLLLFLGAAPQTLTLYVPIVLCTAAINCVIVQLAYLPLRAALHKEEAV